MWKWIKRLWKPRIAEKIYEYPHNQIRRNVDTNTIRARIKGLGWRVLEVPIKRNNPDPSLRTILKWKVVATKGESSCEVTGQTIDDAIKNLGMTLGAVPRN